MNAFTFAYRNLGRNRRRSLVTVLSISIGFAAITLFAGYAQQVYQGLEDQAVYGEMLGHLTVEKTNLAKEGRLAPDKALFTVSKIAILTKAIRQQFPQALIIPRLGISGIVSNGQISTIFIAEGIDPSDMKALNGARHGNSEILALNAPQSAAVASGLASILSLKVDDDATLLVSTIHGQTNASDFIVSNVFQSGNAGTEDKLLYLPLSLARSLYDAEGRAERLTILLPQSTDNLLKQRLTLLRSLQPVSSEVKISTWQELSAFYRQVKSMFDLIFGFLLAIVTTIVVMSVANAIGMSIVERTREIGTLRAIGLQRSGVVRLFITEAVLLVMLGCVIGLILMLAVRYGVHFLNIRYLPPNSTATVPLLIGLDVGKTVFAAALFFMLTVVIAYVPARRSARKPIIDALAHT